MLLLGYIYLLCLVFALSPIFRKVWASSLFFCLSRHRSCQESYFPLVQVHCDNKCREIRWTGQTGLKVKSGLLNTSATWLHSFNNANKQKQKFIFQHCSLIGYLTKLILLNIPQSLKSWWPGQGFKCLISCWAPTQLDLKSECNKMKE